MADEPPVAGDTASLGDIVSAYIEELRAAGADAIALLDAYEWTEQGDDGPIYYVCFACNARWTLPGKPLPSWHRDGCELVATRERLRAAVMP